MVIGGTVIGGPEVASKLRAKVAAASAAIGTAVDAEALNMVGYVQTRKLSGEVLQQRTGRLANSITAGPRTEEKGVISRTVGTNVEYARIHELGGTIDHPGGTPYFLDRATGMAVFVAKTSEYAAGLPVTQAHPIHMPERSFLRSSLKELEPVIRQRIGVALVEALQA